MTTKYERAVAECGYEPNFDNEIIKIYGIDEVRNMYIHFAEVLAKHENMVDCCENCRFYKKRKGEIYDICRLNPPIIFEIEPNKYGDKRYSSKYPEVSRKDWCGKYEYNPDWENVK